MADFGNLSPELMALLEKFRQQFPDVPITSGYRSPDYNAAVGGASGSQHIHGNAFDFSVKGFDPDKQAAMAEWLRNNGAKGFGYYPGSQSMHVDVGSPRYWGPNYSSSSLPQTPDWFQKFAGAPAAPQQVAMAGGETRPPVGTNANTAMPSPVQANNFGSWLVQKAGFELPNPNVAPGSPAQPGNFGSLLAQRMGMPLPAAAPATASASPMGSMGGLLAALAGGAQQAPEIPVPELQAHRPDYYKMQQLFGGLLS